MDRKLLGNTDMNITRIGFGAWAIGGGDWAFGWGPQDDGEAVEAIRRAMEKGINWIDTAAVYGLGHSEELVGKAVKGISPMPYIFTKCSQTWDDRRNVLYSIEPDSIRRECEQSLRRLDIERIDLYQIHWPPTPDTGIEEAWETLIRLKEEGKIRWAGVSNFTVGQMKRLQAIGPVSSLQPSYSLINRDIEAEILPFCLDQNIGVIVYSPMGSGILSGAMTRERIANMPDSDFRKRNHRFREPALTNNLALAEKLKEIGAPYGCSAGEVAIAWTLKHPAVTAAIVGMRNPAQVDGILGAATLHLTDEDSSEMENFTRG